MLSRSAFAILLLLAGSPAVACSVIGRDPNEPVANPVICSANGRFCAVVRWEESVPDFRSAVAKRVEIEESPPQRVTVALYEATSRRWIAEVPIDVRQLQTLLVSDAGRHLIATRFRSGGCSPTATAADPLVTVYRIDGSVVGAWKLGEVFNDYDVSMLANGFGNTVTFELRHESDVREVVVVRVTAKQIAAERRVDVVTAKLLDEKTDIFPKPRPYVSPVPAAGPTKPVNAAPAECAATFDDPALVHLDTAALFRQAVYGPLPEFPLVAIKARIRGTVRVELVVSETGSVLCLRHSALPFGIDGAAAEAAMRWRFAPLFVNDRRARFAGELLFHFQDVDEQMWLEVTRDAPPAH